MLPRKCWILTLLVLCTILVNLVHGEEKNDRYYRAAVMEYSPTPAFNDNGECEHIVVNVENYIQKIKSAAIKKVDIIVFPEVGLTGVKIPADRNKIRECGTRVPKIKEKLSCDDYPKNVANWFKNISCAAKENHIYVALNLIEVVDCNSILEKCPEDKTFIYNSNIVLDRLGRVVARYRKFNLYVEPGFDSTKNPDLTTFTTDFGVTFGIFICFDILFKTPALDVIRSKNVTNFIYSTAWFSELPFLTATQVQQGWAYANNVNLLASGLDDPGTKNAGSGIYSSHFGALNVYMPLSRSDKMLIADVPKFHLSAEKKDFNVAEDYVVDHVDASTPEDMRDEITLFNDQTLTKATSELFDFNKNASQKTILCSDNNFCCSFHVEVERTDKFQYFHRAVAYDGVRLFGTAATGGIQFCGLITCLNDSSIESCGLRKKFIHNDSDDIIFNKIEIEGNFKDSLDSFQFPSTVRQNLLPIEGSNFTYTKTNYEGLNRIELTEPISHLLTFGIYGRDIARDQKPKKPKEHEKTKKDPGNSCSLPLPNILALSIILMAMIFV